MILDLLNFYCQSINLPSKQVTTGAVSNVGAATKFATGTAYSQLNMTFIMPRSQYTRQFFEKWVNRMAPDQNQFVDFFDNYVCPSIRVYKFERGGGDYVYTDPNLISALRKAVILSYWQESIKSLLCLTFAMLFLIILDLFS